jgi:putative ABC transport system ATP-binding protein
LDKGLLRFVWRHSARDQIAIVVLTLAMLPIVYVSLEIPKIIVNEAIRGTDFPKRLLGFDVPQIPFLLLLCGAFLFMVALVNVLKYVLNVSVGLTGERMLRRLRLGLYQQVMRFRLSRFRTMRQGDILQSIMAEVEPLGGFVGEVIATPVRQGGMLLVYVTFIFVQDPLLGLAAVALYPVQGFVVPMLQREVVRLNRLRATNNRGLADKVAESLNQIEDVRVNGAASWRIAQISGWLHRNTDIRKRIFRRKFVIKLVSNILHQLTPFLFYAIGGWLVIVGRMDFGALVAVLAAYKDLAEPWRELLAYWQRWSDYRGRFDFVVENFLSGEIAGPQRLDPADGPLDGALALERIEGGPGAAGLRLEELSVRRGEVVAVVGGDTGARDALLRIAAGVAEPASGQVRVGDAHLDEAPISAVGATVGYVSSEPGLMDGALRDNLVYGLLKREPPLSALDGPVAADKLMEARRTGSPQTDPDGDWVSPAAAGEPDADALDSRLAELCDAFGLSGDVIGWALNAPLSAEAVDRWEAAARAARAALIETIGVEALADLSTPWRRDALNRDASLIENILFAAMPVAHEPDEAALGQPVRALLERTGAAGPLATIGRDIAVALAEIVSAVGRDSRVLDGVPGFSRKQVLDAAELVERTKDGDAAPTSEVREALIALAARYVPARDRLDVIGPEREARLLALREAVAPLAAKEPSLFPLDGSRFAPSLSLAENVLGGPRRHDRRAAWPKLDAHIAAAFEAAGLRRDLVLLGLSAPVGQGGSALTPPARRRAALVRAVVKRPRFLVLNGLGSTSSEADAELRRTARHAAGGAALLYGAEDLNAAAEADILIEIDREGAARVRAADGRDERGSVRWA